ncbi:MAG: OB-fold domain-containing protein, partial [Pseudomonadota bacterium]
PRTMCPFCHSTDTVWRESTGKGVIYSWTVMRRVPEPYAVAYVTLDEGVTLLTNLIDCDFDSLSVGQAVQVKFVDTGEGRAVPFFTTT